MKNKNTMGEVKYVIINIFGPAVALIFYLTFAFIPLEGHSTRESEIILYIMIIIFNVFNVLITLNKRRNAVSVAVNILLPLEIYTIAANMGIFKVQAITILFIASILSLGFIGIVVFRSVPAGKDPRKLYKRRIKHALLGARTIVAVVLCFFMIYSVFNSLTGKNLYKTNMESTQTIEETEEWTIKNNMETIRKLDKDTWESLDATERLNVLDILKNIELQYLGVNEEVDLTAEHLDNGLLGRYVCNRHKIIISLDHLKKEDVKDVIHTLAHECYHAYSEQQVELYRQIPEEYKNLIMFDTVKQYEKEYKAYVDGEENYGSYITQSCEKDANEYADKAVDKYMGVLEEKS